MRLHATYQCAAKTGGASLLAADVKALAERCPGDRAGETRLLLASCPSVNTRDLVRALEFDIRHEA